MIKIVVSVSVIFCALYLHGTFGSPIHDESYLNDHEKEAKRNSARYLEEIRKALSALEEVRQSDNAPYEMVEKDSLSSDVTPANGLDGNDRPGVKKPIKDINIIW